MLNKGCTPIELPSLWGMRVQAESLLMAHHRKCWVKDSIVHFLHHTWQGTWGVPAPHLTGHLRGTCTTPDRAPEGYLHHTSVMEIRIKKMFPSFESDGKAQISRVIEHFGWRPGDDTRMIWHSFDTACFLFRFWSLDGFFYRVELKHRFGIIFRRNGIVVEF